MKSILGLEVNTKAMFDVQIKVGVGPFFILYMTRELTIGDALAFA